MQTVKTAIVVVLLATVVYSAWVALTAPPAELPPELAEIVESEGEGSFNLDDIDIGFTDDGSSSDMSPPSIFTDAGSDNLAMVTESSPTSTPTDLPPPLPPSSSVAGASDYVPPSLSTTGTNRLSDSKPAPATNTTARLSDSDPTSGPSMAIGYEIPARSSNPTNNSVTNTPATSTSTSPTGPGGFQLPDNYSPDNYNPESFAMDASSTGPSANDPASISLANDASTANATMASNSTTADVAATNRTALANAIATADRQQQQDQLREALTTLSLFYNTPSLGQEERAAMLSRLDYLAGEVIYSDRHLLEQPYRVGTGETLQAIAEKLDIPWQLLATINQVSDPARVFPGQELKVVRGPFRAEVNLARSELTVMLGELYAGRFPISTGNDPAPKPGDFQVYDKQNQRTYYALGGGNIPAGDERNPYGDVWLDLGNNMCIHGTGRATPSKEMGCIRLAPSDARDLYSILSKGSSVTVVR